MGQDQDNNNGAGILNHKRKRLPTPSAQPSLPPQEEAPPVVLRKARPRERLTEPRAPLAPRSSPAASTARPPRAPLVPPPPDAAPPRAPRAPLVPPPPPQAPPSARRPGGALDLDAAARELLLSLGGVVPEPEPVAAPAPPSLSIDDALSAFVEGDSQSQEESPPSRSRWIPKRSRDAASTTASGLFGGASWQKPTLEAAPDPDGLPPAQDLAAAAQETFGDLSSLLNLGSEPAPAPEDMLFGGAIDPGPESSLRSLGEDDYFGLSAGAPPAEAAREEEGGDLLFFDQGDQDAPAPQVEDPYYGYAAQGAEGSAEYAAEGGYEAGYAYAEGDGGEAYGGGEVAYDENGYPYQHGEYATGEYTEGAYNYAEGEYTEGAYAEGNYAEGNYAEGGYAAGEYAEGAYTEGAYAEGAYTEGAYTEGAYAEGGYAEGQYTEGAYAEGAYAEEGDAESFSYMEDEEGDDDLLSIDGEEEEEGEEGAPAEETPEEEEPLYDPGAGSWRDAQFDDQDSLDAVVSSPEVASRMPSLAEEDRYSLEFEPTADPAAQGDLEPMEALDPYYSRDMTSSVVLGAPAADHLLRTSFDEDYDLEAEAVPSPAPTMEAPSAPSPGPLPPVGASDMSGSWGVVERRLETLEALYQGLSPSPAHEDRAASRVLPLDWGLEAPGARVTRTSQPGRAEFFLQLMALAGARELHLAVGERPFLRRQEGLEELPLPRLRQDEWERMLRPMAPLGAWGAWEQDGDATFLLEDPELGQLRVSLFAQRQGAGAVFQVVPRHARGLRALGLPPQASALLGVGGGLVLLLGPSGSGLSTTAAALLGELQQQGRYILSLEEAIEVSYPPAEGVLRQREIGAHARDLESAMASALRERPDAIWLCRLDRPALLSSALEAAEAGALVLAPVQAPSLGDAIARLGGLLASEDRAAGLERLASALRGGLEQRLLPGVQGQLLPAVGVFTADLALAERVRRGSPEELQHLLSRREDARNLPLWRSVADLLHRGQISAEVAAVAGLPPEAQRELSQAPARHKTQPDEATLSWSGLPHR